MKVECFFTRAISKTSCMRAFVRAPVRASAQRCRVVQGSYARAQGHSIAQDGTMSSTESATFAERHCFVQGGTVLPQGSMMVQSMQLWQSSPKIKATPICTPPAWSHMAPMAPPIPRPVSLDGP